MKQLFLKFILEPYGIRVNFPNLLEFAGSQVKKYPVTTKDIVGDVCIFFCFSLNLYYYLSFQVYNNLTALAPNLQ